jgi:hypothetical protein
MTPYYGIALFNPNTGRWRPHCLATASAAAQQACDRLMSVKDYGPNAAKASEVKVHALGLAASPETALGLLLDACADDNAGLPSVEMQKVSPRRSR